MEFDQLLLTPLPVEIKKGFHQGFLLLTPKALQPLNSCSFNVKLLTTTTLVLLAEYLNFVQVLQGTLFSTILTTSSRNLRELERIKREKRETGIAQKRRRGASKTCGHLGRNFLTKFDAIRTRASRRLGARRSSLYDLLTIVFVISRYR